ncbi:MAG: hypothetical protein ACRELV_05095, partial [Longimicrobiales bacterium]
LAPRSKDMKFIIPLLVTFATGCMVFGPNRVTEVGSIAVNETGPRIEVPDTVHAGQRFPVTIHTVGPNNCYKAYRTEVEMQERSFIVTPIDSHVEDDRFSCGSALVFPQHRVTLEFRLAGEATVVAVGAGEPDPVRYAFPVVVLP